MTKIDLSLHLDYAITDYIASAAQQSVSVIDVLHLTMNDCK